jgi:hypothetical protein
MFSHFSTSLTLLCCISSTRSVYNNAVQPLLHYTSKTIVSYKSGIVLIMPTTISGGLGCHRTAHVCVYRILISKNRRRRVFAALLEAKSAADHQQPRLQNVWQDNSISCYSHVLTSNLSNGTITEYRTASKGNRQLLPPRNPLSTDNISPALFAWLH